MRTNLPNYPLRARVRWLAFVWAVMGIGVTILLALVSFLVANLISVPAHQEFVGSLSPNRDPIVLQLPAGVPLKAILVEKGEKVRAGQTVALLDKTTIASRLAQLEREILVASFLRECLLSGDKYDAIPRVLDTEVEILMKAALSDCKAEYRAHAIQTDRVVFAKTSLQKRLEILTKKQTFVQVQNISSRQRAKLSLEIALQRTETQGKITQMEIEFRALMNDQDKSRLDRTRSISATVAKNLTLLAILQRYFESPRLNAPEDGRVERVRPIVVGAQFDQSEDLIELHNPEDASFVAYFSAPIKQTNAMREGDPVRINLLGFPKGGPVLHGRLSQFVSSTSGNKDDQVLAEITLSKESLLRLADPQGGIALRGQSTASAIRVQTRDYTLKEMFARSVETIRPFGFTQNYNAFKSYWFPTEKNI